MHQLLPQVPTHSGLQLPTLNNHIIKTIAVTNNESVSSKNDAFRAYCILGGRYLRNPRGIRGGGGGGGGGLRGGGRREEEEEEEEEEEGEEDCKRHKPRFFGERPKLRPRQR